MEINLDEISGEIQSVIAPGGVDATSSRLQRAKAWLGQKRSEVKPWHEFLNVKKISKPNSAAEVTHRIIVNSRTYQANYILISLGLVVYCLITSPLLLFGLGISFGGCQFISSQKGQKLSIAGREFTSAEQYGIVIMFSLVLFFLAGVGSTVFWIIGASIFTVCLHASFLSVSTSALEPDMEMQGIEIK